MSLVPGPATGHVGWAQGGMGDLNCEMGLTIRSQPPGGRDVNLGAVAAQTCLIVSSITGQVD